MQPGKFNIVIGAQAGSESKGKLALYLANRHEVEVISMSSSPNAGHTAYQNGVKYVTYHLPVSCVATHKPVVVLGPTSVLLPEKFMGEVETLGLKGRLALSPRAVIIKASHLRKEKEEGLLRIGSTNQGVGEARVEKIRRSEDVVFVHQVREMSPFIADTVQMLYTFMKKERVIMHEMTQGFDLCLEHGVDPRYCTSKMVTTAQAMAEAGIAPQQVGNVYGVLRPYPIRVNNREGSSGPYAEAKEITWDLVRSRCGAPTPLMEMTTTTKLPRRVFEFCWSRMDRFMAINQPTYLCLQFANYIDWADYGVKTYQELSGATKAFINRIEDKYRVPVRYIGTSEEEMIDRG